MDTRQGFRSWTHPIRHFLVLSCLRVHGLVSYELDSEWQMEFEAIGNVRNWKFL